MRIYIAASSGRKDDWGRKEMNEKKWMISKDSTSRLLTYYEIIIDRGNAVLSFESWKKLKR